MHNTVECVKSMTWCNLPHDLDTLMYTFGTAKEISRVSDVVAVELFSLVGGGHPTQCPLRDGKSTNSGLYVCAQIPYESLSRRAGVSFYHQPLPFLHCPAMGTTWFVVHYQLTNDAFLGRAAPQCLGVKGMTLLHLCVSA